MANHQAGSVEVHEYPILYGRKVITYPKMVTKLA
jgi:hypothetical protein